LVDDYSIADIAVFAWVNTAISMGFGVTAYPALSAWVERMRARPAVARGITIPDHLPAFGGRRYPAADPKAA
jgi:GSH-dependent disulfide-bond oxidoreductase